MPELPEVETIRRGLEPHLVGRRFTEVRLEWPGVVRLPAPEAFQQTLPGKRVREIGRRGKYLLFRLEPEGTLVAHLKMSGALLLVWSPETHPSAYTRAILHLEPGLELRFCDRRKLGRLWLVPHEDEVVGGLGPDCLEPGFTPQVLADLLKKRTAPIKAVLLDQGVVAGLGNMYADEALFRAGLHPLRPAGAVAGEAEHLYEAIREVLAEAIGNRGTSFSDYVDATGQKGQHQFYMRVAHRGSLPCGACGTPIERLALRGRGSYFCPRCQRL